MRSLTGTPVILQSRKIKEVLQFKPEGFFSFGQGLKIVTFVKICWHILWHFCEREPLQPGIPRILESNGEKSISGKFRIQNSSQTINLINLECVKTSKNQWELQALPLHSEKVKGTSVNVFFRGTRSKPCDLDVEGKGLGPKNGF